METEPSSLLAFDGTDDLSRSQPSADDMARSVMESAQMLALSTLQALQALSATQPPAERAKWTKQIKLQQQVLDFLHQTAGAEAVQNAPAISPERLRELGKLIRERRQAADLSQARLAEVAGLSPSTIKAVESAAYPPSRTTLLYLLAVKELKLQPEDLPLRPENRSDAASAPNCYLSPTYEPLKMFLDLVGQLNGPGGYIEQTHAYIDPMSAANWYSLSNQEQYDTAYRRTMPLDKAAQHIVERAGRAGLDVIALGSGDAKQEVRLVEHLIDHRPQTFLRLYLVDISHPLLNTGYRYAADTLARFSNVVPFAIQGNFLHLPRYTQLHYAPERSHRRRIITILGGTIANLDNEVRFFRHCLVGYAPGDFLMMDVRLAFASPDNPDEIRRKDPTIRSGVPLAHAEWFGGPIRRYVEGVTDLQFEIALDTNCPIRGSYALDVIAVVKLTGKRERRFSVFRFRRHDPEELAKCMHNLGWDVVASMPYGPQAPYDKALMLFRKALCAAATH